MHRWPIAHAAPPPHVQLPDVHPSAVTSQVVHAPPRVPHAAIDAVMHVVPVQQPDAHVAAEQLAHAPAVHVPPLPHDAQAPPPVPQFAIVVPV